MAETVANVYTLGRCVADFDDVPLGIVQEAVVTMTKITHEVMIDAYGAPIDAVDGGWAVSAEFVMLEADFGTILPKLDGISKTTGTYVSCTSTLTATRASMGSIGGTAVGTGILKLQSSLAARTPEMDFRIYKAYLAGSSPAIGWNPEEPGQKAFKVKFVGMINNALSDGAMLAAYGDFNDIDA